MIGENLKIVRQNITEACRRSGRDPKEVTLIAVSKTKPVSMIQEAKECGIIDFGENKVQELTEKMVQINHPINWHMIGHLQKNKVKYIVDKVCLIHSVDTFRLAFVIDEEARKRQTICPILLEINVAEETSKFGVTVEELMEFVQETAKLPNVKIKGLMTVAPYVENPEENRLYFRKLRNLYIDIKSKNIDNVDMDILSMGMTGDYVTAIEEGATMVRVGTGIFGERNYQVN